MEEENLGSGMYRPHMGADSQSFNQNLRNQCEPIPEMDDSQLVGVMVVVAGDSVVGGEGAANSTVDAEVKAEVKLSEVGGKRKRGRPPRGQAKPPPLKKQKEEEDVCFICFDGGSLVLCDRRGCPKAYHPACIKRDEAFFRSKARWNCGWHICSICQKAAHYMCYTCPYSVCRGCAKDADYLCVRGDKGFCTTCMKTVMLIENNEQGNKEMAQVDFDDKSSWEYLFKVYWIYLKGKLSLTLTELTQAKNPWKEPTTMACKGQSPCMLYGANDGKGSIPEKSSEYLDANSSKRRKTKEQLMRLDNDSLTMEKPGTVKETSLIGCTEWATKDLLEFVAHMKNGDTSVLSQFDVQELLLDYIKRNNLRDRLRKSQIICDLRLKNLFGKPCVGHFEMLKLLEFHFLIKEEPQKNVLIPAGVVDAVASQVEADEHHDNLLMMGKDKKRKTRRKGEERAPQINLDEYAAIDVHNINLTYLRRNLMESLLEDNEKFHDKVVGSIVRIRISASDQKQDMYRLVRVVGTTKLDVPYKVGTRTADVMLEVLNLDKKEAVSIDAISNQDFSEEECRRLRQSIRCGLVKRPTVGEIQDKAIALQAVRLSDWLEKELLRLNHLRDRASEKGHKKELRECVEKLQLLKTPEERKRRLREIPIVHSDPKMDPNYESEENGGERNDKKQGEYVKPRRRDEISNDTGSRARNNLTTSEHGRNMYTTFYQDKEEAPAKTLERLNEGNDACGSNSSERPGNEVDSTCSAMGDWNNQAVMRSASFAGIPSETSTTPLSMGSTSSAGQSETDKLWHYRDPNGKIQGPFSIVQLQKWSTTGYFPPDMRIWASDGQDDSLLLTDALNGHFHKASPSLYNTSLQSQEAGGASDRKICNSDIGWSDQLTHSSPSHPAFTVSSWQAVVTEPIEFSTLEEDSVSDLLAEVDAMESQRGLASPTSVMNCGEDLIHDPKNECFSSIEVFSPTPNPGKCDALSSTGDIQLPCQSTITNEAVGASEADVFYPVKKSSGQSSTSAEADGETKSTDVPVNQGGAGSDTQPSAPCTMSQDMVDTDIAGRAGSEVIFAGWGTVQQSFKRAEVEGETKSTDVPGDLERSYIQPPAPFTMMQDMVDTDITRRAGSEARVAGWATMQQSSGQPEMEGETKSTDVPDNQEVSGIQPPASFTKRQDMVDLDIVCRAGSKTVNNGWGEMRQSSARAEVEGAIMSTNVPVNQKEAGSSIQPPAPLIMSQQYMVDTNIARTSGSEAVDSSWGTMRGNVNSGWGRSDQGITNLGLATGQGTARGNANMNHTAMPGSLGRESQRRYGGEKFGGPRDRAFQGGNSGSNRAKSSWSRQSFGSSGGVGYSRPPTKGQRVCKFYESGCCKKGALCDYLHP